ncbi:hypothetical protein IQ16_07418 [Bradyrhizobium huanghuaihaiense]|uniref:Uncharacterized protein n=1 Tax=Bradyrhizobium huanghuaihaiense TaxID=990078 RepID=A0A562QW47_9BRAD|nr:hypothetical protein IQ16_07418 [Bradyrhizobium huanghuaihaiense]
MGKDLDDRKLGGNQRAEGMEQGRIAGIDCDSDLMTLFAPVNSATFTKEPNCMRRGGLAGAGITALMSRVLPHISMLPGAISCLIYFAPGLS